MTKYVNICKINFIILIRIIIWNKCITCKILATLIHKKTLYIIYNEIQAYVV